MVLDEGDKMADGSLVAGDWLTDGLTEGDGDGEGEGDGEGDGEGVGVLDEGSARHTVSVFGVVATGAACALPSTPRARQLPLSKVTAAALTCAKRIRIACLRGPSGYRVLFVVRRRLGDGWL